MTALPEHTALLLDLDGTLLDIAPTPDSVVVPPDLPPTLLRLRARLAGALAIVSGRPVAQIEALLPGIATAIAGEHGGAIRHAPGEAEERSFAAAVPPGWLAAAEAQIARHHGALLEHKRFGFVLHYRLAPSAGPALRAFLETLLLGCTTHRLAEASMAWEVKPVGIDKGGAVRAIMARPPFAGRVPVFVGDDVTDRDGIAAAEALGGLGLFVPDTFGDAAGVRAWLGSLDPA